MVRIDGTLTPTTGCIRNSQGSHPARAKEWSSQDTHLHHGGSHLHGLSRPCDADARRIAALINLYLGPGELLQGFDRLSVLAYHPASQSMSQPVGTVYSLSN